jgi:hypothetical protein
MVRLDAEDYAALEGLVDKYDLRGVTEALAAIASAKGEFVLDQAGDSRVASRWASAAAALDRVTPTLGV